LICLTDETKICSECAKHQDHKDHRIKKIKELKIEGAKVKRDLEENLLQIQENEKNQEDSYEKIRKVLISTIDNQFKEIKHIVAHQQLALIRQVNNLFDADKENSSESIFMLKQQMDETIKDITYAYKGDHGGLILLEKLINK